jgi:hypothetical protein
MVGDVLPPPVPYKVCAHANGALCWALDIFSAAGKHVANPSQQEIHTHFRGEITRSDERQTH